jgi:hypothetical protein
MRAAVTDGIAECTPNFLASLLAAATTLRAAALPTAGFAAEIGIVSLLDRRIEGIHIDMNDLAN